MVTAGPLVRVATVALALIALALVGFLIATVAHAESYEDEHSPTYAFVLCRWKVDGGYSYGKVQAGTLDRRIQDDPQQMSYSVELCRQWMLEEGGSQLRIWAHSPGESSKVRWQKP